MIEKLTEIGQPSYSQEIFPDENGIIHIEEAIAVKQDDGKMTVTLPSGKRVFFNPQNARSIIIEKLEKREPATVLNETVISKNGSGSNQVFRRVIRVLQGNYPELGTLTKGFNGFNGEETKQVVDTITPHAIFEVKEKTNSQT